MKGPTMKKGDLSPVLVNIGFGNVVAGSKVIAIVTPGSAPMKRLREEAKKTGRLIDATEGRRTRSIIVTDSNHIILSAIQAETITQRFLEDKETLEGEEE
jgi:extracellular matrix regulatory protein A